MEAAQARTVPITERLRNIKIGSYTVDEGSHSKHFAVAAVCQEAAQEIERLQEKVDYLLDGMRDGFEAAHRLALELECLLLDSKDIAAVSKWWDSAHEALEQWREFCREDTKVGADKTANELNCGYCGRPVIGHAVYCGGLAYHTECTRGPGAQQYAPMPAMPGCTPVTPLTAEDVRRIVREELAKLTPNA